MAASHAVEKMFKRGAKAADIKYQKEQEEREAKKGCYVVSSSYGCSDPDCPLCYGGGQ